MKIFPPKFLLIVAALLLLRCPATTTAGTAPTWQLIFNTPVGSCTIPLVSDYTTAGESITLTDPLIPLRPLANALGAHISLRPTDYPNAVLFAAGDTAWLLLDDCPLAIHITTTDKSPTAQLVDIFDPPQIIDNRFCMPLSFLDLLNLSYDIDPARRIVSVSAAACPSPADEDTCWQTARPLLDYLTTPRRHLVDSFTITIDASIDASIDTSPAGTLSANALLDIASTLHAATIPPGGTFTFPAALNIAPITNSSIFPLQLACRVTPQSLTILVYQLNSPDVAQDYIGRLAP